MRCDSPGRNVSAMSTSTGQTCRREGVLPLGTTPPLTSHRLRRHIKGDVATRSTGATTARRPRTTRNGPDQNMILSTTTASARSTTRSTLDRRVGARKVVAGLLAPRASRHHVSDSRPTLTSADVNRHHASDAEESSGGQGVAGSWSSPSTRWSGSRSGGGGVGFSQGVSQSAVVEHPPQLA